MSMLHCPGCGQENPEQASQCIHCGMSFGQEEENKELRCEECGKEISETDIICSNCGFSVKKKKASLLKVNKKLLVLIGSIVSAAALICIVCLVVMNANPVKRYVYLFNHDKSNKAIEVFHKKIEGNDQLVDQLSEIQKKQMDEFYENYKNDTILFEDAQNAIEKYIKYKPSMNYGIDIKQKLKSLNGSKIAYADGQNAEASGDTLAAIDKYKAVIEEDPSYTDSQNKIQSLENTYKTQLLSEAEGYVNNKQYSDAIANVDQVISVVGSSEDLTQLKQQYEELKDTQYAKVVVAGKGETPKNTYRWIFSDRVNFIFNITNNSDKAIAGISGYLDIKNMFGKDFKSFGCDFTGHTIQPGETYVENNLGYECNQFMDEDTELYNAEYKDLQFKYIITSVVYEDGSSVTPQK
jgi:tetratricopeptide (TPR) repeat protein